MEQTRGTPDPGRGKPSRRQKTIYLTEREGFAADRAILDFKERTGKGLTFSDAAAKLLGAWVKAGAPDFEDIAAIGTFEPRAEYVTSHPIPLYGSVSAGPGALASNTAEDYLPCRSGRSCARICGVNVT